MLTVYAAWTHGSLEADVVAIRRALDEPAYAAREGNAKPEAPVTPEATEAVEATPPIANAKSDAPAAATEAPTPTANWAIDWAIAACDRGKKPNLYRRLDWRSGRDSKYCNDPNSPSDPYHPRFLHRILHQLDRKAA
jgi:hypothetical protein